MIFFEKKCIKYQKTVIFNNMRRDIFPYFNCASIFFMRLTASRNCSSEAA